MKDRMVEKLIGSLADHELTLHRSPGNSVESETAVELRADTLSLTELVDLLRRTGSLTSEDPPHLMDKSLVVDDSVSIEIRLVRTSDCAEPEKQLWLRFT